MISIQFTRSISEFKLTLPPLVFSTRYQGLSVCISALSPFPVHYIAHIVCIVFHVSRGFRVLGMR
jgi:hypothetical protein